jgi:hypothetical protein
MYHMRHPNAGQGVLGGNGYHSIFLNSFSSSFDAVLCISAHIGIFGVVVMGVGVEVSHERIAASTVPLITMMHDGVSTKSFASDQVSYSKLSPSPKSEVRGPRPRPRPTGTSRAPVISQFPRNENKRPRQYQWPGQCP